MLLQPGSHDVLSGQPLFVCGKDLMGRRLLAAAKQRRVVHCPPLHSPRPWHTHTDGTPAAGLQSGEWTTGVLSCMPPGVLAAWPPSADAHAWLPRLSRRNMPACPSRLHTTRACVGCLMASPAHSGKCEVCVLFEVAAHLEWHQRRLVRHSPFIQVSCGMPPPGRVHRCLRAAPALLTCPLGSIQ